MYQLLVTMASHAINAYDASPGLAGLVASIFAFGVLIGRLIAGNQTERIGNKNVLLIGTIIFVVLSFFYFLHVNIYFLILIRILQGIGTGFSTNATATIVAQIIPASRNGEGIGYFSLSNVISSAIGPLIAIMLINTYSYTSIFIFSTIIGMISVIFSLLIKEPKVPRDKASERRKGFHWENFFEKRAIPISIVILVIAFAYSSILSFLTEYANRIDLVEAAGYFFLTYSVTVILSRPVTGKLMDTKGANFVLYPAIILFSIGLFTVSQAGATWQLLLGAVLIGLGYGNFLSCAQALAVKLTPLHRMEFANSTYFIFLDTSIGFGPLLLGLMIPFVGFRGMYLVLAGIIFLTLFLYHFLHGRKDKQLLPLEARQTSS